MSLPVPDEQPLDYEFDENAQNALAATTDVIDNGRITIDLDSKIARVLAKVVELPPEIPFEPPPEYSKPTTSIPLKIVIQVVGSRGDVQPFIALGTELQELGHRVRIATHDVFKDFIQPSGLEFYPIGGDPAELMAYMVKNPGLIPKMKTLRKGDVSQKRSMIRTMLQGCWKACISPDPETHQPFVADAIIANPPSFAHVHCAQALGIPVHIVFTMPWSATQEFPHPLANIKNTMTDRELANYLSYALVQILTWQGLGDVINQWRKTIDLEMIPITEGPFLAETLKIPHTYCWSPSLVPKPRDWGDHIDVSGFLFRQEPQYSPPEDLESFILSGPPPIYIGFGSIVVQDPAALTAIVLDAVEMCGVRAIVSRGWSELDSTVTSEDVFFVGDCPHEWLFRRVTAVVHHGGAGTTACGLLNGQPTVVVPFFGDQPFWGEMVAASGAGPPPIPQKQLTATVLAKAIQFCLTEETRSAAASVASKMGLESGVKSAVESFHRHLPTDTIPCDLLPQYPATWWYSKGKVSLKLSGLAVYILIRENRLKSQDLKTYKSKPIHIENRRWDPFTSILSVGLSMTNDAVNSIVRTGVDPYKIIRQTSRSRNNNDDPGEGSSTQYGKMAGAAATNLTKLHTNLIRGLLVDGPVATTEGFRNVPKLFGEKVPDHRPIVDWKSGMIVGGINTGVAMYEALTDIFIQPVKGAMEEGVVGFGKGFARGSVNAFMKTGSCMLGMYAYPSLGIYKSIHATRYSKTKKEIMAARRVQDIYVGQAESGNIDSEALVAAFDKLFEKKKKNKDKGKGKSKKDEAETTPSEDISRTTETTDS